MSDLNHVTLIGRLTRDAELKFTNAGLAILTFSLAQNRSVKRNDKWEKEPNFFDVTIFGKLGEAIAQYMKKGGQVAVEAHLQQDQWEDKDTGKKRSKIVIVADNIQLLGGKHDSAVADAPAPSTPPQDQKPAGAPGAFVDDVPF